MINEFTLYVYTKDIELIGIIDFFSSIRWRRKYYSPGEFELHLPLNNQVKKYLKKDNLIIRDDAVEVGIVENFEISDKGKKGVEVVISGRFLSSILERRIVKNRINFSGKVLAAERTILSQMTPFSKLVIKDTTLESDDIIFQCTYKNVGTYLNKLAKLSTIAHRITVDIKNKKYVYENFQGLDRSSAQNENTRYVFCEDKSNIESANYTYSSKTESNYAIVGGSGTGDNRIISIVKTGNYIDLDLREIFVDASSESKDENISLEEYNEVLKTKGEEKLIDPTETIEVTVYTDDYKKPNSGWDLGDIVNVIKESWNVSMIQRIIEVEEVIEKNNKKVYATFGTPLAEAFQNDDE